MYGNPLGMPAYNQSSLGMGYNQSSFNTLSRGSLNNNQNLLGGASNPLSSLLTGGLKCSQNEERLMQEKEQRNLLKKYLTQQTGDPIQSALISNTIPGRGALNDFDVGLGSRSNLLNLLGGNPSQSSLLGNLGGNNSTLSGLNTLSSLAKISNSNTTNPGLLSSLVNLAGTPNNNGSILSSLGGLGTGLLGGGNAGNSGGLLGSLQSGMNTLNTLNKVNNAVSSVKGLFA